MIGNNGGLPGVVRSTSSKPSEMGPPKTVKFIFEMKQYITGYFDAEGRLRTDCLSITGDKVLANPFGEEWCAKLGPVVPWLANEVYSRVVAKEQNVDPSTVPELPATAAGARIVEATRAVVEGLR
jgi:hypothetical protein